MTSDSSAVLAEDRTDRPVSKSRRVERVGVVFVHGIGEQGRFEHLDSQVRQLAQAILAREARTGQNTQATFEIKGANGCAYQAGHETWLAGRFPAVRAIVRYGARLENETQLFFHEVWWGDVNEQPNLWKQIRFWGWGLAAWATPSKSKCDKPGFAHMQNAHPTTGATHIPISVFARFCLFFAGTVSLLSSFSVTLAMFFLKRLNFRLPNPVETFVNYMAGVKLYSQQKRSGGSSLDAIAEPPRYTIRRRMVRVLADVALARYDRWYVLAHSLGTVPAFNGLTDSAHVLPNYLDESRWRRLKRGGFSGSAHDRTQIAAVADMMPPRPIWLADDDVVYREKLFSRLAGLLTYGSPLNKFAAIWPAQVPTNKDEAVFGHDVNKVEWINVFDGTDLVGADLTAFDPSRCSNPSLSLKPANLGYKSHPVLLVSHIRYLRMRQKYCDQLVDRTVDWLITGNAFDRNVHSRRWYAPRQFTHRVRIAWAWTQWIMVSLILALAGAWVLRLLLAQFNCARQTCSEMLTELLPSSGTMLSMQVLPLGLLLLACLITVASGAVARLLIFRKDTDDRVCEFGAQVREGFESPAAIKSPARSRGHGTDPTLKHEAKWIHYGRRVIDRTNIAKRLSLLLQQR